MTGAGFEAWPQNLGQVLATKGIALRGMDQRIQARQHLNQALRVAIEIRSDLEMGYLTPVKALPGIALLLADEGEMEWAVELYALARTHPMVANGQWFEDVAGRYIREAAAALPADVVAAAEARGRARDLWGTAAELAEELGQRGWGEGS